MAAPRATGHVSWARTFGRLVWPLGLLAILVFRERAIALLEVPGVPPILAAAILVVGLRWRGGLADRESPFLALSEAPSSSWPFGYVRPTSFRGHRGCCRL